MRRFIRATLAAAFVVSISASISAAEKPKVPAGKPTATGPSVAIVGTGLDYTRSKIANALRRDAELEIVGWDFVDSDTRPFDAKSIIGLPATSELNGTGTRLASVLASHVLLIPIRIDPASPQSLAKGIGFAARTSVRVVLVPNIAANPTNWTVLLAAAAQFPDQLFIVPADEAAAIDAVNGTWTAARAVPNILVVGGEQVEAFKNDMNTDAWRTFVHVDTCGNDIQLLQQSDKTLALGALAKITELAVPALSKNAVPSLPLIAQGADLKRRLLQIITEDLLQKLTPAEQNLKTRAASVLAKHALENSKSDPTKSAWRLVTGCYAAL